MPYLGNVPAEAYTNTVKDSFNGDGSTTAFTLSQPSTTNNLRVVVENVIQDPTVAYTVSGTTLTFTSAPPTGTANIYAVHLGPAVQTAVPPSEINNATTYTSDLTVQGAFTSAGIDDNADATAITIDSSENVLVGKTATGYNTAAGTELWSNGFSAFTRDDATVSYFNRKTSDGTITSFLKDGTEVGSIFSSGGQYVGLGSGDVGLLYLGAADDIRPWNPSTNLARDNAIDLGNSDARFKDLYLSGGVYLGGTGSSNLLRYYEEGTWTTTFYSGTGGSGTNYGTKTGTYTKIGNLVTVTFNAAGIGSPIGSISGLPFATTSSDLSGATSDGVFVYAGSASTYISFRSNEAAYARATITYRI